MNKYIAGILVVLPILLFGEPPRTAPVDTYDSEIGQLPLTSKGKSPFVKIAKELMPTVVSISAEKNIEVRDPFYDLFEDPFDFYRRFFPDFSPYQQQPKSKSKTRKIPRQYPGLGSGFIISEDGYILTNNHVVREMDKLTVKTMDEKEYEAKVVGTDPATDVALIKIDAKGLPYAKLGNSDDIEVGDWVMAIGNPFQLVGTVTVGIVSAKDRKDIGGIEGGGPQIQDFIQTDAAINPGNSGGPLVNIRGEVIGINSAIKGQWNVGIGFAVPINMAKKVKSDLMTYKEVKRGWLGITYQPLNSALSKAYDYEDTTAALVNKVIENSPAAKAGIKEEDIIIEWDGKKVNLNEFRSMVMQTPLDKKVAVKIYRDKQYLTLWVTVGQRPAEFDETGKPKESKKSKPEEAKECFGMDVVSLDGREAKTFNLGFDINMDKGVLIYQMDGDSPAYGAGIRIGDVITKIGNKEISDMADYNKACSLYGDKRAPVVFKLNRSGSVLFIAFTPKS